MDDRTTPIITPDLSEQVYERIVAAIIDGGLAAGTRLRQEELAERFAVSRQPVLQALQRLARDELLIASDRRGTLEVAPLDERRMEEIYELRAQLDALAARRAAERIRAADAAPLPEALLDNGRRAVARGKVGAMVEADKAFHDAIYAACGNRLLVPVLRSQWMHLERAMAAVLGQAGARDGVWEEHAAILAAINSGDSRAAERLARGHATHAAATMQMRLRAHAQARTNARQDLQHPSGGPR